MNLRISFFIVSASKCLVYLRFALFLFLILFFSSTVVYGQSDKSKVDSLRGALSALSGKEKIDMLLRLSRTYREINTDSLLNNARLAYKLSKELNYSKGLANSILLMGRAHHDKTQISEAREYYLQALKLFEEIEDRKGQANAHNNLGNSFMEQGDYKTALKYHAFALLLRAQIDDKQGLASSYNNIGNAYAGEANYYLALNNHLKSLALTEELNDTSAAGKSLLGMSYFNIGRLYLVTDDGKRAEEFLNKAQKLFEKTNNLYGLAYIYAARAAIAGNQSNHEKSILLYSKAIEIAKQIGEVGELADNYTRIAYAYYKIALKSDSAGHKGKQNKNYDIVFNYANQALDLSKRLNYEQGIVSSYILLGHIYREWGDYKNSQNNYNKAFDQRLIPANKIVLYEGLYLLKLKEKNYKEALENYTNYTILKDSVYNTENTLKNASLGQAYEEEQKEKERVLTNKMKELAHNEEIKRQRVIQLFILIGLFIVAIFAFFVYRSYRQKQKANVIITRQKSEVEQAYKIIEEQKKIVDEHNKDITDSINYARRIQTALLASDSLLNKSLPEYFVLYKPKDIVSGDFYWASEITDGGTKTFVLCTGDCTGHGVPGAFMSLLNISKLNETINEKRIIKPDFVLNTVREEIIEALNPEYADEECNDGMDCTLCSFEFYQNKPGETQTTEKNIKAKLTYTAANNPFYLIRNNQLIVGKADKIPVGKSLKEKQPFSIHSLDMFEGDTLYLLTDGYADQFGGTSGKKFKYKQLEELLLASQPETMLRQKAILNETIEKWMGANEQVDDILIIGIRI